MKIILTNHAKDRMRRLFGLAELSVINDVKIECWSMRKELGVDRYMIYGKIARYPVFIKDHAIHVITILYRETRRIRQNKHPHQYKPVYYVLTKKEIKGLLTPQPKA